MAKKGSGKYTITKSTDKRGGIGRGFGVRGKAPSGFKPVKTTKKSGVWFEKTVEYAFALKHLNDCDIVCPLAGKHERAGDAILGVDSTWCLIEFKRDQPKGNGRPKSEDVKFLGGKHNEERLNAFCDDYRKTTGKDLAFHHVVYAKKVRDLIELGACDYWDVSVGRVVEDLLSNYVVDSAKFFEYVELLARAKGGSKDEGSGSEGDEGGGDDRGPDTDKGGPRGDGGQPGDAAVDPDFTIVLGIAATGKGKRRKIFFGPLMEFYEIFVRRRADPGSPIVDSGTPPKGRPDKGAGTAAVVATIQAGRDEQSDLIADEHYVGNRPEET